MYPAVAQAPRAWCFGIRKRNSIVIFLESRADLSISTYNLDDLDVFTNLDPSLELSDQTGAFNCCSE
jgi:hypothetical protein